MVLAWHWVFCKDIRTDSDFCFIQHKLIGFYNHGRRCLLRGTNWFLIESRLRFDFKRLKERASVTANMFRTKKEEVTRRKEKLHIEDLYSLHSKYYFTVNEVRETRWVWDVSFMWQWQINKMLSYDIMNWNQWTAIEVIWTLKWNLKRYNTRIWIDFSWFLVSACDLFFDGYDKLSNQVCQKISWPLEK